MFEKFNKALGIEGEFDPSFKFMLADKPNAKMLYISFEVLGESFHAVVSEFHAEGLYSVSVNDHSGSYDWDFYAKTELLVLTALIGFGCNVALVNK